MVGDGDGDGDCVGVRVGVGARDGVGASDGVGLDVSGADVSGGGESDADADGAAESVPGELAEGESDGVPPGSGNADVDDDPEGELSVGVGIGACGSDVVSGPVGDSVTTAERVVVGDVSGDVPLAEDPDAGAGAVDPGGKVTGSVTKLAVGCPESSAGSSASAPVAPCNVPSAYRCAAVTTFVTYANEWLYPYRASTRPVGVRRSTFEAQRYRAADAAASEMFSGFGAAEPLVAGLYSRHVAGRNCIGPTARSNDRSASSTPPSVSLMTGNPSCPLSTGPRIAGLATPDQPGLPEPPPRPWSDSTSPIPARISQLRPQVGASWASMVAARW